MKKCSRTTARSITWSKLAAAVVVCWLTVSRVDSCGCGSGVVVDGVDGVWAKSIAVNKQTRETDAKWGRNIFGCFILPRIAPFYLGCELKHDVQYRLKIRRPAVLEGGFELDFLSGLNRRLV